MSHAQNGSSADAPVVRRPRLSPFTSVSPFGPLQDKDPEGEEEVFCMPCDVGGDVVTTTATTATITTTTSTGICVNDNDNDNSNNYEHLEYDDAHDRIRIIVMYELQRVSRSAH